jgi:hypothetical protein
MAQSGELSTSISYIKYRIIMTESSTSGNTSLVRIQVRAWGNETGTNYNYEGQCGIKIDGVEYPVSTWSKGQKAIGYSSDHGETGYTTLYDNTHTVYHNYDGSKSIRVSAYFELYDDGYLALGTNFNNSYSFDLTTLNPAASTLNAVGDLKVYAGESIKIYVTVPNTSNTHTLVLKDGNTTVLTISNLSLVDGYNTVSLTESLLNSLISRFNNNGYTYFVGTWVLTTKSGSTTIGSASNATSLIYNSPISGTTMVSIRSTGIGIKNTNPQAELDVNGEVKCTVLNQTTPSMQVVNGVLQFLRW